MSLFSSSLESRTTCCPLPPLHSLTPLYLCPFTTSFLLAPSFHCPPILPGPMKCHPSTKTPVISWLKITPPSIPDPHSVFSWVTLSTLYASTNPSQTQREDWSFSNSFLCHIMNPCSEPQKLVLRKFPSFWRILNHLASAASHLISVKCRCVKD